MDFVMNRVQRPRLRFLSLENQSWRQRVVSAFPNRFYEKLRVSYSLEAPHKVQDSLRRVPTGFRIQQMEKAVAERGPECSQWFRNYWPDADQFLSQSLGYGLVYEGQMVSVAYLIQPTSHAAEIVVETDTTFRGQGLAPICCAALVQACLERHIEPLYSADQDHHDSTSVAQKWSLGMRYFIVGYPVSNVLSFSETVEYYWRTITYPWNGLASV
jgi:hypothetical protein